MNDEFYELVENAIDAAFEKDCFLFNCYSYLKHTKTTRKQVREFINSTSAKNVALTCADLEAYIKGGDKTLREAYGFLGKPKARKIHKYLQKILTDAVKYEIDRKPGRKKRSK
jgi:hypothetical protein|tara:strand:- start:832 stop:1170 length:339 start_codon:yes stop_codon:yes gene_type:complete